MVAYSPYPLEGASSRYRVYALADRLAARGVTLDIRPLLDSAAFAHLYRTGASAAAHKAWDLGRGMMRRWSELAHAGRYDVALVHRQIWPLENAAALERLRRHQPRWVYDFDDAVFLPHVSEANRAFIGLKPVRQYADLVAGAAGVAAGNAWLAAWARAQRPGRDEADVALVPTAVDVATWTPAPCAPGPPRLVWIGSPSTAHYLDLLQPVFRTLGARHPELELHVMGAPYRAGGLRVVQHPWSLEAERRVVAESAIGLSPLADTDWERGKCGHKLLLYMACGLASVASPVGVHVDMVADGVDGFLCGTTDAYVERIEQLLGDPALRERMGRAARARVERDYSLDAVAPRLAAALERAAGTRP